MNIIGKELSNNVKIDEKIGEGGFAFVYKGWHKVLDIPVGVKILKPVYASDKIFRDNFLNEAKRVAKLREESHIISIYDAGLDMKLKVVYIIMDYYETDVEKALSRNKQFLNKDIVSIAKSVCKALKYAHSETNKLNETIIHSDIKPGNILLSKDTAILTDFGISKAISQYARQTGTKLLEGTPHYMAPEQFLGKKLTPATDIYSLGITLYEMATGKLPYEGNTEWEIGNKHISSEEYPVIPSELNPNLNKGLENIIFCAMAKDPLKRFQTADEMLEALNNWQKFRRKSSFSFKAKKNIDLSKIDKKIKAKSKNLINLILKYKYYVISFLVLLVIILVLEKINLNRRTTRPKSDSKTSPLINNSSKDNETANEIKISDNIKIIVHEKISYDCNGDYNYTGENFGYLNISSSPTEANVCTEDGKFIGKTPLKKVKLEAGKHTLFFKMKSYKIQEYPFILVKGETKWGPSGGLKLRKDSGYLTVTSNDYEDKDYSVYVDEKFIGKTPIMKKELIVGNHLLTVTHNDRDGYKYNLLIEPKTEVKIENIVLTEAKSKLTLETNPSGATVYIRGIDIGKTPLKNFEIPIGHSELSVKHPYCKDWTKVITPSKKEHVNLGKIQLEPKKVKVTIKSKPNNSNVYIDDKGIGKTPILNKSISILSEKIEVKHSGYNSKSESINLIKNPDQKEFIFKLTPRYGSVEVTKSSISGTLYINGKRIGNIPQKKGNLLEGSYNIRVASHNTDQYKEFNKTIIVKYKQTTQVTPAFGIHTGTLTVKPQGRSNIYIDGEKRGSSPPGLKDFELNVGKHTVRVDFQGGTSKTRTVVVKKNETVQVHLEP